MKKKRAIFTALLGLARMLDQAGPERARRRPTGGTVNDVPSMDPLAIQRVAVERDTSLDLFRAQLRDPGLLRGR